jgi:hypothetical protein
MTGMTRGSGVWLLLVVCVLGFGVCALGQSAAVSGFVRDAANGEPLAYCNVYLDGTEYGAASSEKGYYYIGHVPAGTYTLAVSFVGYKTTKRSITVADGQSLRQDVELAHGSIEVGEVKVTAERSRFEREVEVSAVRLDPKRLSFLPKIGGEVDIFRTIQSLPGVIATSDFSNKLYIRGGSPDQNLILLDGITVYNPSHLFGMFSPFISDAVSDITLLAGGFPAKYGGRLSSVLDVATREGNSKQYTGSGSASVVAAQGLVEGPLPRGSFLVAGRRTYLPDLLLSAFGVDGVGYYFYDLMGKANYAPWQDGKFTLAGIMAEDVLNFWDPENRDALDAKLTWGNRGVSLRWNQVFTPVLYGEVVGAWSNFRSDFSVDFGAQAAPEFHTDLTDYTLKSDLTWYWADHHTLDIGAEAKLGSIVARFAYDTIEVVQRDTLVPLGVYADEKWDIIPEKLFLKPGLRFTWDPHKSRFAFEPRFGLKYRPAENTAINAAAGRFTQPMVTLNSTDAVLSVYDIWVSVPERFKLPEATHFILGGEQWLRQDLILSLEGYYKDYSNLLETRYGDFFTPPDSLLTADGYSYGAELMLRKTEGWVNGWVSYSYAWTRRSIGDEVYHPHYDRRHSVNVVLSFPQLIWGFDVSAKWTLGTGLPYAGTIGYYPRYEYNPIRDIPYDYDWGYIEGGRDAFRYPPYHRLDAGISRTWVTTGPVRGEFTLFLDVTNVYNQKNVLLYYWDQAEDGRPVRKSIGQLPILPTLGVKVRF